LRPEPTRAEIAEILAEQAERESAYAGRCISLARRCGFSADARAIIAEDCRLRYDAIVIARQIVLDRADSDCEITA